MFARISAIIAVLVGAWIFGATLVHSVFYSPTASDNAPAAGEGTSGSFSPAPGAEPMPSTIPEGMLPARLVIPRLGIDARIEPVGLTAAKNMGTPSSFADAAWYKYGTVPGYLGSAVIAGHVDNGLSLAGVFKNLNVLVPGDEIYVVRRDSSRVRFVVESSNVYESANMPLDRLFNLADQSYLNLITCTGKWNGAARTYDSRLVVSAVRDSAPMEGRAK